MIDILGILEEKTQGQPDGRRAAVARAGPLRAADALCRGEEGRRPAHHRAVVSRSNHNHEGAMARRREGDQPVQPGPTRLNLTNPAGPTGFPAVSGNRHQPRRADDRVRLRGVPVRRPARRAHATIGVRDVARWHCRPHRHRAGFPRCRRCAIACRASTPCSTPTVTPTTCSVSTTCVDTTTCSEAASRATAIAQTIDELRRTFGYIFDPSTPAAGGLPEIDLFAVHGAFSLGRTEVIPVPLLARTTAACRATGSARWRTSPTAARFRTARGSCSTVSTWSSIDALRHRPHPTHFTVAEALGRRAASGSVARVVHAHLPRPAARRHDRQPARGRRTGI